jgi:hypothetical protein
MAVDNEFETFLADARSLDPTIRVDCALRAWTAIRSVRTLWELRQTSLTDDEWLVVRLATRAFFQRLRTHDLMASFWPLESDNAGEALSPVSC